MNRRNFFKAVSGLVAGIYAAFVPESIDSKHSGTRPATKEEIIEKDKLLAAVLGPPRCEPCYDDCPHQIQCYGRSRWTDTHSGPTELPMSLRIYIYDDAEMIQEAIDLAAEDGGTVYLSKGTYNIKTV